MNLSLASLQSGSPFRFRAVPTANVGDHRICLQRTPTFWLIYMQLYWLVRSDQERYIVMRGRPQMQEQLLSDITDFVGRIRL